MATHPVICPCCQGTWNAPELVVNETGTYLWGQRIPLDKTSAAVLGKLLKYEGKLCSTQQLLDCLPRGGRHTLAVHMSYIRKYLKDIVIVKSQRNEGYVLNKIPH